MIFDKAIVPNTLVNLVEFGEFLSANLSKASGCPKHDLFRGGSKTTATSKMESFVIIVNGFQPLTIITKRSILDVAAVLDPPLLFFLNFQSVDFIISYLIERSHRGGSRAAATSKMERLVIIVNGFQPLTIITKRSILDVAAALDPPLSHGTKINSTKIK